MNCISNESDFKLLVKFKDTTQTVVNPLDFEWDLLYYTIPEIPFIASHKLPPQVGEDHILTPNIVILDDWTIEVRVDNFNFCKKGELKYVTKFYFKNPDFKDGIQTIIIPEQPVNILIV